MIYFYYLLEFRDDILKGKFKKQEHDSFQMGTSRSGLVNVGIITTTSG